MSYYPEPDNHIRVKVKLVLDFSNYAAKRNLIALKAEIDKQDIYKLVNVPTSLNNLQTEKDDLDVHKLKTVPKDLKKLSDAVSKEVVKNIKLNTLNTII